MVHIPVKDKRNLYRDSTSKAIINCDQRGYNKAIALKNSINRKKEKEEFQEHKIDRLEQEVDELKDMMKQFINNFNFKE